MTHFQGAVVIGFEIEPGVLVMERNCDYCGKQLVIEGWRDSLLNLARCKRFCDRQCLRRHQEKR